MSSEISMMVLEVIMIVTEIIATAFALKMAIQENFASDKAAAKGAQNDAKRLAPLPKLG